MGAPGVALVRLRVARPDERARLLLEEQLGLDGDPRRRGRRDPDVRHLHRAGEGAPFTGLKPAGRDLGPAIPAADKALETGDATALTKLLTDAVEAGVREHFHDADVAKGYSKNDVDAGRKYVQNYVTFVHFVEGIRHLTR